MPGVRLQSRVHKDFVKAGCVGAGALARPAIRSEARESESCSPGRIRPGLRAKRAIVAVRSKTGSGAKGTDLNLGMTTLSTLYCSQSTEYTSWLPVSRSITGESSGVSAKAAP